jgi:hypothetical protein
MNTKKLYENSIKNEQKINLIAYKKGSLVTTAAIFLSRI